MVFPDVRLLGDDIGGATVPFVDITPPSYAPLVSWDWDFGDGGMSTQQHPTHTFPGPGAYSVSLMVTDALGGSDSVAFDYIVASPPTADFEASSPPVTEGATEAFNDASTDSDGGIVQWLWQAVDNSDRTSETAFLSFDDNGSYDVTLTVTDSQGLSTSITKPVLVENVAPTGNLYNSTLAWVSRGRTGP